MFLLSLNYLSMSKAMGVMVSKDDKLMVFSITSTPLNLYVILTVNVAYSWDTNNISKALQRKDMDVLNAL